MSVWIIQLFTVVFCAVRNKHKIEFRVVIKEPPNKWRPVEGKVDKLRRCLISRDVAWKFIEF